MDASLEERGVLAITGRRRTLRMALAGTLPVVRCTTSKDHELTGRFPLDRVPDWHAYACAGDLGALSS